MGAPLKVGNAAGIVGRMGTTNTQLAPKEMGVRSTYISFASFWHFDICSCSLGDHDWVRCTSPELVFILVLNRMPGGIILLVLLLFPPTPSRPITFSFSLTENSAARFREYSAFFQRNVIFFSCLS